MLNIAASPTKMQDLSIDCVILGFEQDQLKVLLCRRAVDPFWGEWALPGGFINRDEDLDHAATRILNELTGVSQIYLEQINAFGSVNRYPEKRVITIGYYALINPGNYTIVVGPDISDAHWVPVSEVPNLVFDHGHILQSGLETLRKKVRYEPIGFELLPTKFTLTMIQRLYEAVLSIEFDVRNFRKKLLRMNLLIRLDEKQTGVAHRAAWLYKFDPAVYKKLTKKGFVFDL